jgi:putative ABC transport system permease protein
MNVITRGMRNALRSPVRSGAIVLLLAISIGLILAMLVARTSVNAKISEVKATTATEITINPAGIKGGLGGGDPLTADQVKKITDTAHISTVSSTLTDQLGTTDTNLAPSFELGAFGKRQMRFESSDSAPTTDAAPEDSTNAPVRRTFSPRTSVTGTTNPETMIATDKLTSGTMIDGSSSNLEALVGKALAEKNSLKVGSTFTAYGKNITVKGIFDSGNAFENNGLVMPLSTLQTLTSQPGAVNVVTATADSSDNVAGVVTALKTALGDKADITSQQEQSNESLKPLESIAGLALSGVIGAAIASAAIILLSMIMVVRERRREIGVIKAIGGTNAKVVTQFTVEALTLTVIGGLIGLVLGVLVSGPMTQSLVVNSETSTQQDKQTNGRPLRIIGGPVRGIGNQLNNNIHNVTSTLTPQTIAGSIGIILLIAIIGSAIPAWAIARVRPAEVLRTE